MFVKYTILQLLIKSNYSCLCESWFCHDPQSHSTGTVYSLSSILYYFREIKRFRKHHCHRYQTSDGAWFNSYKAKTSL